MNVFQDVIIFGMLYINSFLYLSSDFDIAHEVTFKSIKWT